MSLLADRVRPWIAQAARAATQRPVVVGISGPQGSGKSTLVRQLVQDLGEEGLRAAALSIDDFYLRREDQLRLAAKNPGNRSLEHRGYPGTHDVALGVATLDALRHLRAGEALELPAYDKSAHGGRGDRATVGPAVVGPLDVVLFEGWMLGFRPVAGPLGDPDMRKVNELLAAYRGWHDRIDRLVVLMTPDPETIVRWRVEAEEKQAAAGKPALSRADIEDYIRRFLPAYALYGPTVATGPWAEGRQLVIRIGADRSPSL